MNGADSIPYLSEETLAGLGIGTDEVIESIEALIIGSSRSTVWNAPKAVIQPPDGRYVTALLAAADDPAFLTVKTLILNPRNSDRGLPQINGVVVMLDSQTGLPAAVLDGNWITAVRTAAMPSGTSRWPRPLSGRRTKVGRIENRLQRLLRDRPAPLPELTGRLQARSSAAERAVAKPAHDMRLRSFS